MWPEERGLRGRGAADDGLLARPERPRRWTLPMTALRVMPPSSAAIWLADRPSAHNFLRSSTRSSVQLIGFSPSASRPWMESSPVVGRTIERQTRTRQECTRSPVARYVVLSDQDATIGSDSGASTHGVLHVATNSFPLESAVAAQLSQGFSGLRFC